MTSREQQADQAASRGDFATALLHLGAALRADSGNLPLLLKTAALQRGSGDDSAALRTIDRALAVSPLDFTALLMRATCLYARGGIAASGEAYARALAQAPNPAPQHLLPVLELAGTRHRSWQSDEAARLRRAAGDPADDRLQAMIDAALRIVPPERDGPTHYCYPGLAEFAFHDRAAFPWLAALEAATDAIAAEFAAVYVAGDSVRSPYIQYPDSAPVEQWRTLNHNRDWTAIHLIDRGRIVAENARHCLATMEAVSAIPQPAIPGAGPNVMFSLLAPRTHIPPHTGVANTRLVCHLPLIVPDGCWFRVGEERRDWVRGEAWVFDDTVEHEAMNPTDAMRVVLIIDVWHPDLDARARHGIAAVMAGGGQIHAL